MEAGYEGTKEEPKAGYEGTRGEPKEFVRETVANTESRIIAELRIIEAKRRWW